MLLLSVLTVIGWGLVSAAPYDGTLTVINGEHRETVRIPRHSPTNDNEVMKTKSEGSEHKLSFNDLNINNQPYIMGPNDDDGVLVRRRRLADDKKLDLKMKMQRVKKVVSLDAIGSYSVYRSDDRKTSLKAFGSTELWYDGTGFGLKKPGLGVQFTIYY